jgi:hypothetical protein
MILFLAKKSVGSYNDQFLSEELINWYGDLGGETNGLLLITLSATGKLVDWYDSLGKKTYELI